MSPIPDMVISALERLVNGCILFRPNMDVFLLLTRSSGQRHAVQECRIRLIPRSSLPLMPRSPSCNRHVLSLLADPPQPLRSVVEDQSEADAADAAGTQRDQSAHDESIESREQAS